MLTAKFKIVTFLTGVFLAVGTIHMIHMNGFEIDFCIKLMTPVLGLVVGLCLSELIKQPANEEN